MQTPKKTTVIAQILERLVGVDVAGKGGGKEAKVLPSLQLASLIIFIP